MGRRYLGYNRDPPQKAKTGGVVHNKNKQAVNGCRVILLDSALQLQVKPRNEKPKLDLPEVPKKQANRIVFEVNDHASLIKSNKKPKVNFVEFIDRSKVKTKNISKDAVNVKQDLEKIKVKQKHLEESSSESNKNTNNSLVHNRIMKTNKDEILKNSKPVLNLIPAGTIKKVSFVPIKPKIILDKISMKRECQWHRIQLETQETQKMKAQPLNSTKSTPAHSTSSLEEQLLNKKICLQRVIKLHPLNLNTFKSSQKNKKHQLSSILKTVITNNLSNEQQKNSNKEAFPVALKSIDNEDIRLLDLNPITHSSEQILGI